MKVIDVRCWQGHLIFGKYRKAKKGFLMKCYIDMIGDDMVGVKNLTTGTDVYCPECKKEGIETRIGRIGLKHGRPAVIINHGKVKKIQT